MAEAQPPLSVAAAIAFAVVLLIGSGCGHPSARDHVLITAAGRVGPLHVDKSDRSDVVAFAGKPDAERRGRSTPSDPLFDALGYGCHGKPATYTGGGPACETVYYLDARSGELELFYTADRRFSSPSGVHVGTTTSIAEALMHRLVIGGCFDGLTVSTTSGFLVMWFEGGKDRIHHHPYYLYPVGGHVAFIVVHSNRLNPAVLDCIDS